jgi:hypothetical protein
MKPTDKEIEDVTNEINALFDKLSHEFDGLKPIVVIETCTLMLMASTDNLHKDDAIRMIASVNLSMAEILVDICSGKLDESIKNKLN